MNIVDKAELRRKMRAVLSSLSVERKAQAAEKVACELERELYGYDSVMLYMALPSEVDVSAVIASLIAQGKKVYLPRVNGDNIETVAYDGNFREGAFSIQEPTGEAASADINAVVMPLLAVDREGNRLGKGRGYYDRFLADRDCYKIAVCFEEQYLDKLPCEKHDIKADKVIIG